MMKQSVWVIEHWEECPPVYTLLDYEVFKTEPQVKAIINTLIEWKVWDDMMAKDFEKLLGHGEKRSAHTMGGMTKIVLNRVDCLDPITGQAAIEPNPGPVFRGQEAYDGEVFGWKPKVKDGTR